MTIGLPIPSRINELIFGLLNKSFEENYNYIKNLDYVY